MIKFLKIGVRKKIKKEEIKTGYILNNDIHELKTIPNSYREEYPIWVELPKYDESFSLKENLMSSLKKFVKIRFEDPANEFEDEVKPKFREKYIIEEDIRAILNGRYPSSRSSLNYIMRLMGNRWNHRFIEYD